MSTHKLPPRRPAICCRDLRRAARREITRYDLGRDSAFIDVGSGYGSRLPRGLPRCSDPSASNASTAPSDAAQTAASSRAPPPTPTPPRRRGGRRAPRRRRASGGGGGGGLAGGVQQVGVGGAAALGRRDAAPGGELHTRLRLRPRVREAHNARPRPPAPSGALLRPRVVPPAHRVVAVRADEGRRRRTDPDAHLGEGDGHVLGLRQHPLPRSLRRPRPQPGARRRHASAPPTLRCLRPTTAGAAARPAVALEKLGWGEKPGWASQKRRSHPRPRRLVAWGASAAPTRSTSSHRAPRWVPLRADAYGLSWPSSRRPTLAALMPPQPPPPPAAAAAAAPPKPPPLRLLRRRPAAAAAAAARAATEAALLGGRKAAARAPPPPAAGGAAARRRRRRSRRSSRRGGRWRGARLDLGGGRDVPRGPARVGLVAGAAEARGC